MVSFENILSKITIQDVVLVILVILVIYLMFKSNSSNSNNENFDTDGTSCVSSALNPSIVTNINSLANIAVLLTQADTTTSNTINIPSNNVIIPDTLTVTGDLTIDGDVTFTGKDSFIMEIFPKFMILAWGSSASIPLGWAPCDGGTYSIASTINNPDKLPLGTYFTDYANYGYASGFGQLMPDFRDRFILSANNAANAFNFAGEESVTLTIDEMPWHTHRNAMDMWGGSAFPGINPSQGEVYIYTNATKEIWDIDYTGSGNPHNNMPPYMSLLYIMKL